VATGQYPLQSAWFQLYALRNAASLEPQQPLLDTWFFGDAAPGTIAADLSAIEEGDTLAATGALRIAATLTVTEEGDTLASAGNGPAAAIDGTLAATEADDTLVATGELRLVIPSSPPIVVTATSSATPISAAVAVPAAPGQATITATSPPSGANVTPTSPGPSALLIAA